MEAVEPIPQVKEQEVPVVKKAHGNKGKPPSEKQREALKKGMEALKLKREQMAKEKDERKKTNEELKAKGLPLVEPPIKLKKKDIVEVKPVALEPVQVEVKQRKPRRDKGTHKETDPMKKPLTREEFMEMRTIMSSLKPQQVVKEVVVEKPIERVIERPVEKTKVLTGSDLLNAIFFK